MNLLKRLVDVRSGEARAMLLSAAYFFFVLCAYYIIRPIRDEMGAAAGVENLPWLFTGTMLAMLACQPLFAAVTTKFPARKFIPLVYRFFIANLLLFFVLLRVMPDTHDIWIGRVFYIWTSVFNMFVVSVFWAFMVDIFRTDQGKRLFGFIGMGGTIGAISGGTITVALVERLGPVNLLIVSAVLIEVSAQLVMILARYASSTRTAPAAAETGGAAAAPPIREDKPLGGTIWSGITHVAKSPYLLGVVVYMLLFTITTTFLYFQQSEIAATYFSDRAARTAFFAKVDIAVNVLTLVTQAFITHRLLQWFGVGVTLAILPAVSVIGFAGIGLMPTLALVVIVQVIRRAGNYAVARPTREVLYTVVAREDKYKAKSFIDTFVYRFGDQVGAWSQPVMTWFGLGMAGIAFAAVPLSGIWLLVSLWLGKRQAEMVREGRTTADRPAVPASSIA